MESLLAALIKGGFAPLTPTPSGELFAVCQTPTALQGEPPAPPLIVLSALGSYPELCAKRNFYLCPLAIRISEKRIVSLAVNLPILKLQFEHQVSV